MLNSYYLYIIKTPYQNKIIQAFRLYLDLKEIDSIQAILKEFKSQGERKKERKLNKLRKRYMRTINIM